jgi:glutaredoxin
MDKEILIFVRSSFCGGVALARDLLTRYQIPYREVEIDKNPELAARLKEWTGFLSVPTLIVVKPGEDSPYTEFLPPPTDRSLKGFDRGPMITEPTNRELENWLHKHDFLEKPYQR